MPGNVVVWFATARPGATGRDKLMHPRCTLGRAAGAPEHGMSRANAPNEWDLIVPDDDAELAAELRRHGVKPGQRLHVAVVDGADAQADDAKQPSFFSSFDEPPDLAARSGDGFRAASGGGSRRPRSAQQPDRAARSRGGREANVTGEQLAAEPLGERYVGRVVGGEVRSELVDADHERERRIAVEVERL
jgi:hypothetical protein